MVLFYKRKEKGIEEVEEVLLWQKQSMMCHVKVGSYQHFQNGAHI